MQRFARSLYVLYIWCDSANRKPTMSVVENIQDWLATEASAEERAHIEAQVNPPGGAMAALNAVVITGPQLLAAVEMLEAVPGRTEADMITHSRMLNEFAVEYGFQPAFYAGPALHCRAMALSAWCIRHDPYGMTKKAACFEAAARAPLVETAEGPSFEPADFSDLVRYIEEMPF